MSDDIRLNKLVDFVKEIQKLKLVQRRIILSDKKTMESSAEHSWEIATYLILFRKELPEGLDNERALKISLAHVLVEIYAGDVLAFDKKKRIGKEKREEEAAIKLFSKLPKDLEEEFMGLHEEYCKGETKESKVVKSFDKIQPIIQNIEAGGQAWKDNNVKRAEIDEYKRKYMLHDKNILDIYEKVLQEASDKCMI